MRRRHHPALTPDLSDAHTRVTPTPVGPAYRSGLDDWVRSRSSRLDCVEIRAEDFYKTGAGRVRQLAQAGPQVLVQGGRLSLGTPGPLPADEVTWLSAILEIADPPWFSEPVGFRRTGELELPAACPVRADPDNVERIADRAREASERCGRPLLLENIPAYMRIPAPLSEPEFLSRLCERSGCGLLVDLAALFVNARGHRFDPRGWLGGIEERSVVGLRVGACASRGGRWLAGLGEQVPDGLWELAGEAIRRFRPRAIVLAHEWELPHPDAIEAGLERLSALAGGPPPRPATRAA